MDYLQLLLDKSNEKFLLLLTLCVFALGCEIWSKQEGVASLNGELYPFTSLSSCLRLCVEMLTCVAVDVSEDACVVHTNISDTVTTFNASSFAQYTVNRTCASSTTISAHSAARNVSTQGTTRSTYLGNCCTVLFRIYRI